MNSLDESFSRPSIVALEATSFNYLRVIVCPVTNVRKKKKSRHGRRYLSKKIIPANFHIPLTTNFVICSEKADRFIAMMRSSFKYPNTKERRYFSDWLLFQELQKRGTSSTGCDETPARFRYYRERGSSIALPKRFQIEFRRCVCTNTKNRRQYCLVRSPGTSLLVQQPRG